MRGSATRLRLGRIRGDGGEGRLQPEKERKYKEARAEGGVLWGGVEVRSYEKQRVKEISRPAVNPSFREHGL